VHFADFDLDGHTDLLFAHGKPGIISDLDEQGEPVLTWPIHYVKWGGVELFKGEEGGAMVEAVGAEPPEHSERSSYGIMVGDFYGKDGRGDGCMDVVVTPVLLPRCVPGSAECVREELIDIPMVFRNSAGILRNRCADESEKAFVGVRSPTHDSGAVARLRLSSGKEIHRPIRAAAGIAGTSETSVVFALPNGESVEALELIHPKGTTTPIEPSAAGYSGWLKP